MLRQEVAAILLICKALCLKLSSVIYLLYSIVCFGILNVTSLANYIFTFFASLVILVWFLYWGTNATRGYEWKSIYAESEE